MQPLNYDIVNTGRETLAHLITTWEHNLTAAVAAGHKKAALDWGALLLGVRPATLTLISRNLEKSPSIHAVSVSVSLVVCLWVLNHNARYLPRHTLC